MFQTPFTYELRTYSMFHFFKVIFEGDNITCHLPVPKEFIPVLRCISSKNIAGIANMLWKNDLIKAELVNLMRKDIDCESQMHCSHKNDTFFLKDSKLETLDFQNLYDEFQQIAPISAAFLESMASNHRNLARNLHKKENSIIPGIVTAAATLLKCRNNRINKIQSMNSIILRRGGANKMAFKRMNARFITTSYKKVLELQSDLGEKHDEKVYEWGKSYAQQLACASEATTATERVDLFAQQNSMIVDDANNENEAPLVREQLSLIRKENITGFSLVGDNVDIRNKARHYSRTHGDKDHHMFHLMAVKHRVPYTLSGEDPPPCSDELSSLLPSHEDNKKLKLEFRILVGRVLLKYKPEFNCLKEFIPDHINHFNAKYTNKKSDVVSS